MKSTLLLIFTFVTLAPLVVLLVFAPWWTALLLLWLYACLVLMTVYEHA